MRADGEKGSGMALSFTMQLKRTLIKLTLFGGSTLPFSAQPALATGGVETFEFRLLHAVDTLGLSPFVFNVTSLNPEGNTFGFAESVRNTTQLTTDTSDGASVETKTEISETTRAATFLAGGKGITFGGGVNHGSQEHKTTSDLSDSFSDTPLLETFKRTSLHAKVSLELSQDFRLGAVVRYKILDADVLGNLFMPLDERTKYSGTLLGAGGGAQFTTQSAAIAVQYLSPLQGKVGLLGEDKVTSETGFISGCAHIKFLGDSAAGGCYLLPQHTTDELREDTTGPNPDNGTTLSPKGVHTEHDYFLSSVIVAGFSAGFNKSMAVKVSGSLEDYVQVSNPTTDPGEIESQDDPYTGYRGRVSFQFFTKTVFAEIGGDYATRERRQEDDNSSDVRTLKTEEFNFFGLLGLSF